MHNRANLFIESLDNKFRMISRDDLLVKLNDINIENPMIIDFRDKSVFEKSRIKNSINMDIKNLSEEFNYIDKNKEVIAVCNGSMQSSYAIYYLYLNGFDKVYNLSGGFSGCLKNNYPAIEYFEQLHHINNN
ncbi:MAG: rhodanese-like domain-containing protein [Salinivirgaceae bacterium]|jgi:rhodanese-related sulfurtransferase|nr:rhodanese-like domain-containing protein [Salinivirgaceae bacterium]